MDIPADGIVGPQTHRAVRQFQAARAGGRRPPTHARSPRWGCPAARSADSVRRVAGATRRALKIAQCESGGDPTAVWAEQGLPRQVPVHPRHMAPPGRPATGAAPEAEGRTVAMALYRARGTVPGPPAPPSCSAFSGYDVLALAVGSGQGGTARRCAPVRPPGRTGELRLGRDAGRERRWRAWRFFVPLRTKTRRAPRISGAARPSPPYPAGADVRGANPVNPSAVTPARPHPQDPRRDAADDGVGGHVLGDDRAGADDRVVADRDAAQDAGAVADPAVVADVARRACRSPAGGSAARPRRRRGRSRSASRGRRRCTRGRSRRAGRRRSCTPARARSWPRSRTSPSCARIFVPCPIHDQRPRRSFAPGRSRASRPGRRSRGRR